MSEIVTPEESDLKRIGALQADFLEENDPSGVFFVFLDRKAAVPDIEDGNEAVDGRWDSPNYHVVEVGGGLIREIDTRVHEGVHILTVPVEIREEDNSTTFAVWLFRLQVKVLNDLLRVVNFRV